MTQGVEQQGEEGLIRSLSRRGIRADKSPPIARKTPRMTEPTICESCGALLLRKTWRRGRRLTGELLERAVWALCPACIHTGYGKYHGRLVLRGDAVAANLDAIRRRIRNVALTAALTQPERRIVSDDWNGSRLEILTTSQELAHRVLHELKKAFGGSATYAWSDRDGSLLATWQWTSRRRRQQ